MSNKDKKAMPPNGEILLYLAPDGTTKLNVRLVDESIWLSQADMAELFGCTPENIIQHLGNIYSSGELQEEATAKDFLVVRTEGSREVSRKIRFYDLDAYWNCWSYCCWREPQAGKKARLHGNGNFPRNEKIQLDLLSQPAGFQCFILEPMSGIEPETYSLRDNYYLSL